MYNTVLLYKDVYKSWYSVQDESFLTSTQVHNIHMYYPYSVLHTCTVYNTGFLYKVPGIVYRTNPSLPVHDNPIQVYYPYTAVLYSVVVQYIIHALQFLGWGWKLVSLSQSISFMVLLQTTTVKFWNVKIFEKRRRKSGEDLTLQGQSSADPVSYFWIANPISSYS